MAQQVPAESHLGDGPSTVEDKKAGKVYALAEAGDKIFLGGEFESLVPPGKSPGPGIPRRYLAALDRHTGQLLAWDVAPDDVVLTLVASPDGRILYVGGRFGTIGGSPAGRIAAFDVATGERISTFSPPSLRGREGHGSPRQHALRRRRLRRLRG
ncbi:MAG: hypothetical protein ACRDV9_08050 [Acidimicrobiia bacterium]